MVDRRILAIGVAIFVVVLAVGTAMTGPAATPDEQPGAAQEVAAAPAPVSADTPIPPATQLADQSSTTTASAETIEPAGAVPVTVNEVADLVESRRPAIEAVPLPDGHHDQDGEHAHGVTHDVAHHAGELVVAAWSWRFDDVATRHVDAIGLHASDAVLDALVPTDAELERRRDYTEVAWVIIRDIAVDDGEATVVFDHHVVTSSTPESVTSRTVVVDVEDHRAIDVRP